MRWKHEVMANFNSLIKAVYKHLLRANHCVTGDVAMSKADTVSAVNNEIASE